MNVKETPARIQECQTLLSGYHMPQWEELPSIDLYMDQVIELVNRYLDIYRSFQGENFEITRPMINNYVKLNMMPAPEKKKYSKIHLAYILVICTLKQTLNISTIRKILPTGISDDEVKKTYTSFVQNQEKAFNYVHIQLENAANPILKTEDGNPQRLNDLIMQVASSANILKCLTEKIIDKSE